MRRVLVLMAVAASLMACGRSNTIPAPPPLPPVLDDTSHEPASSEPAPVDPELLAAPNAAFTAIEPSEVGIAGAPDLREAISPLTTSESGGENGALTLSIRETAANAVVDIVRSELPDDAVAAGQVRIEFRKEAEGWFPTNAYRRNKCRRGVNAMQWTTELCP